jgi:hypothetical protein
MKLSLMKNNLRCILPPNKVHKTGKEYNRQQSKINLKKDNDQ